MRAQDIHARDKGEIEIFDDEKRMMKNDVVDFKGHIDIAVDFRACATDTDNVWGDALKRLNRGLLR